MKLTDIVNKLRSEGHKVTLSKRKDGGVEVTSIDGTKYSRRRGNARAREMTGQTIRKEVREKKILAAYEATLERKSKRKSKISKEEEKLFKKAQRTWKKKQQNGSIRKRKWKKIRETEGKKAAEDYLNNILQKANNLIFDGEREWLVSTLNRLSGLSEHHSIAFANVAQRAQNATISQDVFEVIHELLYELEKGTVSEETVLQRLRRYIK